MNAASCARVPLEGLVSFKTGKLDSSAAIDGGAYPFFTCARETLRTSTYSFDGEAVILAGNNANGVYPIKFFHGRFDAYQRTYIIRSEDIARLDNRYLYYALTLQLTHLQSLSTGAATKFLTLGILKSIDIALPPLGVQHRVAAILSAYDDLIENNMRRITLLEEMARSLYKEWFVQLRFPGHERVKRVPSQVGQVPSGWRIASASEATEINPRTAVPKDGEKPFVPMTSLSNDSMLITGIETRGGNSGARFKNGDTLFARITPCLENGKTGYVQFLPDAGAVAFGSTELMVMREKLLSREMTYLLARSAAFRDHAIKSMTGASGRQRVQDKCFDTFLLAVPPQRIIDGFTGAVRPMFGSIHALAEKNRNLRATRELLLARLISGEIDVSSLPDPAD